MVGEAGKKTNGIANVKAAYYTGKDKFTKIIFACTFQCIKMLLVWTVREMGRETDGTANVKLVCNVGKDKFPKNIFTGKTFLRNNFFGFRHLLGWTFKNHQVVGHCRLHGNRHRTFVFIGCRGIKSMCLEHVINVGVAAQLDVILSLKDVNTVALLVKTSFSFNAHGSMFGLDALIDLCNEQFGSVWGLGIHCKVINLSADWHVFSIHCTRIDILLMDSDPKSHLVDKNLSNEVFPWNTG